MEEEKNEFEKIINSMRGSNRAVPRVGLLNDIEDELFDSKVKIIPFFQRNIAAAAAVLLLFLNGFIVTSQFQSKMNKSSSGKSNPEALVSDYSIYK